MMMATRTKRLQPRTLNAASGSIKDAALAEAWSRECLHSESSHGEHVAIETRIKLLLNSVEGV